MEMSNNKLSDSLMDEDFKRDSELYKIGSTVCAMFNLIDGGHIDGSTFECIQNKDQVLLLRSALTNYSTKNGLPCIAVNTPGCYGCAIRSSHIKRCTNTDITQEKSRCTMGSNQGEIAENENRKYGTVIRYSISSFDNVHNESISNSISDERLELTPKSLSPMHTRAANSQTGALDEQGVSIDKMWKGFQLLQAYVTEDEGTKKLNPAPEQKDPLTDQIEEEPESKADKPDKPDNVEKDPLTDQGWLALDNDSDNPVYKCDSPSSLPFPNLNEATMDMMPKLENEEKRDPLASRDDTVVGASAGVRDQEVTNFFSMDKFKSRMNIKQSGKQTSPNPKKAQKEPNRMSVDQFLGLCTDGIGLPNNQLWDRDHSSPSRRLIPDNRTAVVPDKLDPIFCQGYLPTSDKAKEAPLHEQQRLQSVIDRANIATEDLEKIDPLDVGKKNRKLSLTMLVPRNTTPVSSRPNSEYLQNTGDSRSYIEFSPKTRESNVSVTIPVYEGLPASNSTPITPEEETKFVPENGALMMPLSEDGPMLREMQADSFRRASRTMRRDQSEIAQRKIRVSKKRDSSRATGKVSSELNTDYATKEKTIRSARSSIRDREQQSMEKVEKRVIEKQSMEKVEKRVSEKQSMEKVDKRVIEQQEVVKYECAWINRGLRGDKNREITAPPADKDHTMILPVLHKRPHPIVNTAAVKRSSPRVSEGNLRDDDGQRAPIPPEEAINKRSKVVPHVPTNIYSSRIYKRYQEDELEEFVSLMNNYGPGWANLLRMSTLLQARGRTAVDLKDKWRNLLIAGAVYQPDNSTRWVIRKGKKSKK